MLPGNGLTRQATSPNGQHDSSRFWQKFHTSATRPPASFDHVKVKICGHNCDNNLSNQSILTLGKS